MKVVQLTRVLDGLGWSTGIDDGDRYAVYSLPDRIVDFGFNLVELTSRKSWGRPYRAQLIAFAEYAAKFVAAKAYAPL